MNADCITKARWLRKEAGCLLREKGVHAILQKYGNVIYTGSYALNVMSWRDIDLYLDLDRDENHLEAVS